MSQVIIYNLDGELLGTVTLKHAIKMLYRQVAQVHESVPGEMYGPYPRPRAVMLLHYVYARWRWERKGRVPYSKQGVMRRDRHRCAYCEKPATTVDHVIPRCQGGSTDWLNVVAACERCNCAKGGLTPDQAGIALRHLPFVPVFTDIWGR
ncbi:hypothetical protein FHX74_002639 [Friedmanniella endophytica]|uniref:HNH nuclease domain-containing protein n=1 Tax=Microlunatus kandeliicorticis TaxID=1759536 RepID=A0A7W3ITK6_9ACTN|nr:HNH endonuclease [Microlunatus kandeliicorticis]MBA8795011.1 hypothetical protein [Microlunatus kandeliicorticis]